MAVVAYEAGVRNLTVGQAFSLLLEKAARTEDYSDEAQHKLIEIDHAMRGDAGRAVAEISLDIAV